MVQRKKIVYRLIYLLPLAVIIFFIILGIFYERTFVRVAELKPMVIGADNIAAKLYLLDAGLSTIVNPSLVAGAEAGEDRRKTSGLDEASPQNNDVKAGSSPAAPAAGDYLLVLSEADGLRVEGYYIDLAKKTIGYANFSGRTYTPLAGRWAMLNREVLTGCKITEELTADFQNLPEGVMITLKGPGELALTLDAGLEQLYKKRLIFQKTILLER